MAAQDGRRSADTSTQIVALGGALAVIGLAAAQHLGGYDPPPGLEGALTVALSTLLSWYLPARRARTIPVRDKSGTPNAKHG